MYTRSKIFQLNGFYAELEASRAQVLLEDLLAESEKLYGHSRNSVEHANPDLCRYFYKTHIGTKEGAEYTTENRWHSEAEVKGQKLTRMLGDEAAAPSTVEASPTWHDWTALLSPLKKLKGQLQSMEDQVLLCQSRLATSTHADAAQKKTDLQAAKESLQEILHELRMHLMTGTTEYKKTDDCSAGAQMRSKLKNRAEEVKAECAAQIELCRKCYS